MKMSRYNELNDIECAYMNLANTIRSVSPLWRDEKYSELAQSLIPLSGLAKRVIEAGEKYERSVNNFESIARESV